MAFCLQFCFDHLLILLLYSVSYAGQLEFFLQNNERPQMLFNFFDSFSLLFCIIIELIIWKIYSGRNLLVKKYKPISLAFYKKRPIQVIPNEEERKKKPIMIICIIILSIFTAGISYLSLFLFQMTLFSMGGSNFIFNLLLTWIVSRSWSHMQLHRHHILALIILSIELIIIIAFFLGSKAYPTLFEKFSYEYWLLGLGLIGIIVLISLRELLEKYALEKLFINYLRLLFYEGIISFIIHWISFGIIQLIECKPHIGSTVSINSFCNNSKASNMSTQFYLCFDFTQIESLWFFLYIIATLLLNIFRVMINHRLGPTHRYNGDVIASILFVLLNTIRVYSEEGSWIFLLLKILPLIGCFIYNENIRIYLFKMANNTRVEIKKRAMVDVQLNIGVELSEDIEDIDFNMLG